MIFVTSYIFQESLHQNDAVVHNLFMLMVVIFEGRGDKNDEILLL